MLSLILYHPGNGDITSTINLNKIECGPTPESEQLKCNATLVIAPSHLVHQWESEIKHFKPYFLNGIKISTKSEHSKISYQDILQCQIVIVSAQFLGNNWNYRDLSNEWNMHINRHLSTRDHETLKSMNDIGDIANGALRRSRRVLGKQLGMQDSRNNSPLLGLFYWRRIILDEALQIGGIRKGVLELEGEFKWYVSGTPFPRCECVSILILMMNTDDFGALFMFDKSNDEIGSKNLDTYRFKIINKMDCKCNKRKIVCKDRLCFLFFYCAICIAEHKVNLCFVSLNNEMYYYLLHQIMIIDNINNNICNQNEMHNVNKRDLKKR